MKQEDDDKSYRPQPFYLQILFTFVLLNRFLLTLALTVGGGNNILSINELCLSYKFCNNFFQHRRGHAGLHKFEQIIESFVFKEVEGEEVDKAGE